MKTLHSATACLKLQNTMVCDTMLVFSELHNELQLRLGNLQACVP